MLARAIYDTGIRLYRAGVGLAAMGGKKKASLWLDGRQHWRSRMEQAGMGRHPLIWVHAASLGEFEQGRPVLEALRRQYPGYKILLTFFSPSGYEVRKDYPGADYIYYLPLDTRRNARDFISIARPALALFIKYEFWYHFLTELYTRKIPVLLVSGIFRENQLFFKGYGGMFRRLLQQLTHIFVQNESSMRLLQGIGIRTASISGDTRFDRVAALLTEQAALPLVAQLAGNSHLLVAGSTWPEDEQLLASWWRQTTRPGMKMIIAPHEIHESHIRQVQALFPEAVTYSALKAGAPPADVLIIDNIGMLTTLYRYAYVAYVGGGFGKDGIHNLLEPAVYSKPVIIGPEYSKYFEAVELVALKGALVVSGLTNLEDYMQRLLNEPAFYEETASIAGNYVKDNKGATEKILQYIQENRFLNRE
ncbi:3-deoxy-D-manno-octulosonic acid transferase [Chitinophaga oryzae]|uniref:3-deoxy-D-manno-octulosonic acid transferase n=1 Tax=Chitinophaga oryzae TaxID=2725414 RepID=A0ABX6LJH8_9BACT|nr:glycosyltransferase N-terminal domain-containing protein [Chitinophaga oryzae]QJB40281.1 3-deoxy-D-manno-octulosonic acid transferase [Chitinophaga oryzae]